MNNQEKEVSEQEVEKIALEHILQSSSSDFTLNLVNINKSNKRYPCWSVVFEMRNQYGNVVDGPLVLGIDEYGEIVVVG